MSRPRTMNQNMMDDDLGVDLTGDSRGAVSGPGRVGNTTRAISSGEILELKSGANANRRTPTVLMIKRQDPTSPVPLPRYGNVSQG